LENKTEKRLADLSVTEFLNCFSLPVVIGSVVTAFFFSQYFRSELSWSFYWLLPSTVWLIYTIDHVLDGEKLGLNASSLRHRIHFKYRKELRFLAFLILVLNTILAITTLSFSILIPGSILATFVLGYFILVHKKNTASNPILKEIMIALGACIGMMILPGIPASIEFSLSNSLLIAIFFGINLSNILIFSYFDYHNDISDGFSSGASVLGLGKLHQLIITILITCFFLVALWTFAIVSVRKLPMIMALMLMINILGMIMMQKDIFKEQGKYRLWGDMIYLVPGLIWFLLRNKFLF